MKPRHYWFGWYFVCFDICSAPSHYLIRCWFVVQYTHWSKYWWYLHHKRAFIQEKDFGTVACKMWVILPRPQCIDTNYGLYFPFNMMILKWLPRETQLREPSGIKSRSNAHVIIDMAGNDDRMVFVSGLCCNRCSLVFAVKRQITASHILLRLYTNFVRVT